MTINELVVELKTIATLRYEIVKMEDPKHPMEPPSRLWMCPELWNRYKKEFRVA